MNENETLFIYKIYYLSLLELFRYQLKVMIY